MAFFSPSRLPPTLAVTVSERVPASKISLPTLCCSLAIHSRIASSERESSATPKVCSASMPAMSVAPSSMRMRPAKPASSSSVLPRPMPLTSEAQLSGSISSSDWPFLPLAASVTASSMHASMCWRLYRPVTGSRCSCSSTAGSTSCRRNTICRQRSPSKVAGANSTVASKRLSSARRARSGNWAGNLP